jgi:putative addiction module component (TIGR02574 family)
VPSSELAQARIPINDPGMAKPAIDVSSLTPSEKFDLIDELWQSLQPEDFALTSDQRAELDRRLDRLDRDGPTGMPWAVARERMVDRWK